MSRRHADIWSHPGHYLVDPYTWPWSPNGQDHIWLWKFTYQGHGQGQTHCHIWGLEFKSICLLLLSWQSDHFWLRYSKFHIWPWKFKVKATTKVKSDGQIWGLDITRVAPWGPDRRKWLFSEVRGGIWTPHSPVLIKISADKRPVNQLTVKKIFFSLFIKTFCF